MLCPSSPFLLALVDVILSSTVVAPLVVAHWRGTWEAMDLYLVPLVGEPMGSYISLALGFSIHLFLTLSRPLLNLVPHDPKLTFVIFSRAYTTIFGIACVNCWKGAWKVMDHLVGMSPKADGTTFSLALAFLVVTRTLRNISAPPFAVAIDSKHDYFSFQTFFRTSPTPATKIHQRRDLNESDASYHKSHHSFIGRVAIRCWYALMYLIDCLISVVAIGSLVVLVWRGAWYIMDHIMFPANKKWSAFGSLVLGYSIVVLVYALQIPVQRLCSRLKSNRTRLVIADIYVFAAFCGTVNVWRGVWNLLNLFFLPETPMLSNLLTFGIPLVILIMCKCSNSILVRGVMLDAEEETGSCVVFPILYVRYFIQNQHQQARRGASSDENLQTVNLGEAAHPLAAPNHYQKELDAEDYFKGRQGGNIQGRRDSATSSLTEDVEREAFVTRKT